MENVEEIKIYSENGDWEYSVYIRALTRGKIELSISNGASGENIILTAKNIDELIAQLRKAKKISMARY